MQWFADEGEVVFREEGPGAAAREVIHEPTVGALG
jgi:hypothetical protein